MIPVPFFYPLGITQSLLIIWFHLMAATVWIGGMCFLSLVLAPLFRAYPSQPYAQQLFRAIALRFRVFARVSMGVLILTGLLMLHQRMMFEIPLAHWHPVLIGKLALVGILIGVSLFHDMVVGPMVGAIREHPEHLRTPAQHRLVKISPWISRLTLVLGLGVLYVASILARL